MRPLLVRTSLPSPPSSIIVGAVVLIALLARPAQSVAADATASAYQRSYEQEAAGQIRAALATLRAIAPGDRASYFYQLRLGWLLHGAGEHQAAIAAYRKAAGLAPGAVEPWVGATLPQMALRRWKDVEHSARKALRLDPHNYLASARLAWATYNLGRHAEAERLYRRVLQLYPADLEMKAGLGWSLFKQGKQAAAAGAFAEVLAVSPKNVSAVEGLRAASR